MRTGYLGLGSNVGDRESHLRAAIELLRERGVEVEAVSSAYETEPVGEVLDQADFLNAAIRIRTDLEPEALLDLCKEIEVERGRALDAPRHSPRPLDVDLLLLGDLELTTERLTLPHPEVTSRRFVLAPLLELDPELALPDGTAPCRCPRRAWPGAAARRARSARSELGGGGCVAQLLQPGRRQDRRGVAGVFRDDAHGQGAGGAVLDRRAQVVERHRQARGWGRSGSRRR